MTIVNPMTFEKTRQYDREDYDEDVEIFKNTTPFSKITNSLYGVDEDYEDPHGLTVIVKQHIPITDDLKQVFF